MRAFLNPWILLGVVLAIGSAFGFGMKVGGDREVAAQARLEEIVKAAEEAGQRGAAAAIAKQTPIHKTIQSKTKEIVRENTIYQTCVNEPTVEKLLDDARANHHEQ